MSQNVGACRFPLTLNQEQRLFTEALMKMRSGHVPLFHVIAGFELFGELNPDLLQSSINQIVSRHKGLRSGFLAVGKATRVRQPGNTGKLPPWSFLSGTFEQVILPDAQFTLRLIPLEDLAPGEQEARTQICCRNEYRTPFDYLKPPLMRGLLFRYNRAAHLLVLIIHHLVFDIWSMDIFVREMAIIYSAGLADVRPDLPKIRMHFPEFAVWQRQKLDNGAFSDSLAYWQSQWKLIRVGLVSPDDFRQKLHFTEPTDNPGLERESFTFGPDESRNLNSALRGLGVTRYVLFWAALLLVLHKYTGKKAISIWANFANRLPREAEDFIGWTTNSRLLACEVDTSLNISNFLSRTRTLILTALAHQQAPTAAVIWESGVHRLGNLMIAFDSFPRFDEIALGKELKMRPADLPFELGDDWMSGFYLRVTGRNRLKASLIYSSAMFSQPLMSEMLCEFRRMVVQCASDPGLSIAKVLS